MIIVGIDPGKTGSIIRLEGNNLFAWKMPPSPCDLHAAVKEATADANAVYVEKVWARRGNSAKSNWSFAYHYGQLNMAVELNWGYPTHVTPKHWMTVMECLTGGDKNISKQRAIRLMADEGYEGLAITHWNADGILIAKYGEQNEAQKT